MVRLLGLITFLLAVIARVRARRLNPVPGVMAPPVVADRAGHVRARVPTSAEHRSWPTAVSHPLPTSFRDRRTAVMPRVFSQASWPRQSPDTGALTRVTEPAVGVPRHAAGFAAAAASAHPLRSRQGPAFALGGRREEPVVSTVARRASEGFAWATDLVQAIPAQVESYGALGPLYFILVFVSTQQVFVPITLLTLTAGYIFGFGNGTAIAIVASMLSSTVGYFLSRTLLRPQIMKIAEENETFQKINKAAEKEGFKIVLLSRASLVINYSLLNFLFGISSVKFIDFLGATFLGFTPEVFLLTYVASTARTLAGASDEFSMPTYVYGIAALALLALVKVVSDIAKRAMDESLDNTAPG